MNGSLNWRGCVRILSALAGAAVLAAYCASCALDINDKLGFMWVGRNATVAFLVLRRIVWQVAMTGGVALLLARLWRERSNASVWNGSVGMLKLGVAVFGAMKVSTLVGMILCDRFAGMRAPIEWLGMWRLFQVIEILLLIGLIPFLLAVFEFFQKQVFAAKSLWMRVTFVLALGLGVFLGLGISSRIMRYEVGRCAPSEEEDDEDSDMDKEYRLTEDEPGEVNA